MQPDTQPVVFALAALLVEGIDQIAATFVFLVPLNVAQKLMFVLFLLAAQGFEDKPLRSLAYCSVFLVYRIGLNALLVLRYALTDGLALDTETASGVLVAAGCVAIVGFAVWETVHVRPVEHTRETPQENIDYYRRMAFDYYLMQRLDLTQRESGVAALLAQGKDAQTIASELSISRSTVKTHLHNVYAKAGVHSQAEFLELVEHEQDRFFDLRAGDSAGA